MNTHTIKTFREAGLFGYRIYFGRRKVGAKIAQFETEAEAVAAAEREVEWQTKGPLVTIHDPRYPPMPHLANMP